jgi:predicted metal-binding membrane protein
MSVQEAAARRAPTRDPAVLLWTVAGLLWTATVLVSVLGRSDLASHDEIIERSTMPWTLRIGAFLLIWTVMVGAMMLPSTVPMTRLFVAVSARAPRPHRARATLAATYLTVWLGFGLVALAGDRAIHATVDAWPWLDEHSGLVKAGLLGAAGIVQFSALKDRCLTACRDPMSMLWQHYRRGAGAWRLGWHHALNCLGCCWALMLVMFGVGVGNLAIMLGLAAVMVAEKTTRWGRRLVTPVGVVLLVSAVALALGALGVAPFAPTLSTGLD